MSFPPVPFRQLILPAFIALVNVLILFPMVLTIIDLAGSVNRHVFVLTSTPAAQELRGKGGRLSGTAR